jgi:hypothetical protein
VNCSQKNAMALVTSIAICFGFGFTANSVKANEVDDIIREMNQLEREITEFSNQQLAQDRQKIAQLSCSQLVSEANQYSKNGDYWSNVANNSTSDFNQRSSLAQATGNYDAADRRWNEYSRRCR